MSSAPGISMLVCALFTSVAAAQNGPTMEDLIANPADYAGQTLTYSGVTLSGNISRYDVGGVRKYYLTVGSRNRTYEVGFFLAPPDMADKLYNRMNARQNYTVNLTFKVARIVVNDVGQWHGFVNRVDFLDGDGQVTDTVTIIKK